MQIILASDNHFSREFIDVVNARHPDADLYFHCGDSEMEASEIRPFISVLGNNDLDYSLPKYRTFDLRHHSIFITHGHHYGSSLTKMAEVAKAQGCDILFYGHSHVFNDQNVDGVRCINPGSTFYNRDRRPASYAVIDIDDDNGEVRVTRREIVE